MRRSSSIWVAFDALTADLVQYEENRPFVARLLQLPAAEWMVVNETCSDLPIFEKNWQKLLRAVEKKNYTLWMGCLLACWFPCPTDSDFVYIFFTVNQDLERHALFNREFA